jgi:hypothetical protein
MSHSPRVGGSLGQWLPRCNRGCCHGEPRDTFPDAWADARQLVESAEVEASLARTDAYARRHPEVTS